MSARNVICNLVMLLFFPAVVPCLSEMTAVMSCWKVNSFDDVPCRSEIQDFVACAEKAVSHNKELDLYKAHTPRAHCAIYRSAFVAAWLYQDLIDPISPWALGDISQNTTDSLCTRSRLGRYRYLTF